MMGRGADGGRVADGNSCPIQKAENLGKTGSKGLNSAVPERSGVKDGAESMGMDVFSQVYKALATRHPFEKKDGAAAASDGGGTPQAAAGLVDGRRRPKKVQGNSSGAKIGKSREGRCSNPWDEFEEFFCDIRVEDVELLQRYCSYSDLCFNIRPSQKNGSDDLVVDARAEWRSAVGEISQVCTGSESRIDARQTETVALSTTQAEYVEICEPDHAAKENGDNTHCCGGRETTPEGSPELEMNSGARLESCAVLQERTTNNHIAGQDDANYLAKSAAVSVSLEQEQKLRSNLEESHEQDSAVNHAAFRKQNKKCVETKLFASSIGRKKRKMVSESAVEVMTSTLSPPENGEDELCHVCYNGDIDEGNQILFCDVCNVAVHQQCYGVQEIRTGQWLCSWCSYCSQSRSMCKSFTSPENGSVIHKKSNGVHNDSHPCILCPVGGGALKPVYRSGSHELVERCLQFAHLFCSNWIPETYVENPDIMEPIVNVEGIREGRWKLLCSLCKDKHGACIQCRHGNCTTAFHPLCAREMQLRMEISSRKGTDDVELWAFCPKHTLIRAGRQNNSGADSSSEAEIGTSKENGLSHYSNEICLRQNTQLPSTLSECQSFHAQELDKKIADRGDLPQKILGIENKISEGDSVVQGSFAAAGFCENDLNKVLQNTNGNGQNEYLEKSDAASTDAVKVKQLINNGDLLLEKTLEKKLQNTSIKGEGNSVVMEGHSSGSTFEAVQVEMPCIDMPTDADIEQEHMSHGSDTRTNQRMYFDGTDRLYSKAPDEVPCSHGTQNPEQETISRDYQLKQLSEAMDKGILDLAPKNEVESEILFWHQQLLENVQSVHRVCDDLVFKVITDLPRERKEKMKQKENKALADEFQRQAREAKKQGRKERRHKEAQATAAAATAAAAASSRIGSRKDGSADALVRIGGGQAILSDRPLQADELSTRSSYFGILPSAQLMTVFPPKNLKTNMGAGRPSSSSQPMARTTLSRPTFARVLSEKSYDESLLCDICQLPETTRANKLFICCHCKVLVHENCYGINGLHSAEWRCEPCQELHRNYPNMKLSSAVRQGGPACILECALCGGRIGILKRSIDGQWVHNFCAEWILENTFRRGQSEPVVGLESLSRERGMSICSICHRQQGVCLKCNFGHCHTMFHPLCARDSGFLMSVSTHIGKIQHKAYCEKHSAEQKLKSIQAESWRCGGTEELKFIKQLRVMLERMRLICERTVRREKVKRELVHNTHNELASKRDFIAYSAVFHGSFPSLDVGSNADIAQDSVVTSVWKHKIREKHHSDGNFFASTVLSHPRAGFRNDNSFGRTAFSGDSSAVIGESESSRKRSLYVADSSALDDRDDVHRRSKKSRTHAETLKREVVMTPIEANMQNQRLPKGYAYVPVRDLAKGKTAPPNFRHDS